ncbi:MAG: winged helix-turn-helix transcriptional regulator [Paracoccaceae bacterium]
MTRRISVPTEPAHTPDDDQLFRLLRQLDRAPDAAQRATAEALGVSLGALNAHLRAAADAGYIRVAERKGPDRRQRFTYELTTKGAAAKARLTDRFLARKLAEYDALHAELTGTESGLLHLKKRTP